MCFGPFSRLLHWGPLTALSIIKLVTGMTIHCGSMWWPPVTFYGFLNSTTFLSLSGLTLYNFLSSMFVGPGFLPKGWEPEDMENANFLQWCSVCEGYKAPRSHHCRRCNRCVLKMDHHCPWINNCVGWANHANFTYFLLFATLGCFHSSIVLGCSLYRALFRVHYIYYGTGTEPIVMLSLVGKIMTVLALGFAIGVVAAVGLLLYFQFRSIMRNRTGIEDWILEKASFRRRNQSEQFVFPYNLGVWKNCCQVLGYDVGNGVYWPVVEGCDQYTLTREQIEQKNEKRLRTKLYNIVAPASGAIFPITKGLRTCINFPYTDEPRIKLVPGDQVLVTRWRKYWLFGERIPTDGKVIGGADRVKGWFPRSCGVETIETTTNKKSKKLD